ncbi:MAG: ferrous iron transport protein B [Chitinophagales bacterium]|nr:ferrous iron transport protein B [Chitinophagales bacterium]MDW8394204.1 ferrous iron transport protein B [Chitinophagales bacterium]
MNRFKRIALVGSPNSGKSSLFNQLTGLRQKVGNFPGVTVDKRSGWLQLAQQQMAEVIDLPGIYSLHPRRLDEYITFDVLLNSENEAHPDLVVLVADATNLKRSLLLCSQVLDLRIPAVVALNMVDLARSGGLAIDTKQLARQLGVKVVPINARDGKGITELKRALQTRIQTPAHDFIDSKQLADGLLEPLQQLTGAAAPYAALQIACHYINFYCFNAEQKARLRSLLEQHRFSAARMQAEETLKRYERIGRMLDQVAHQITNPEHMLDATRRMDRVLLHPIGGYVILLLIFLMVFQAVFSWAQYPMDAIDGGIGWLKQKLAAALPAGVLNDLLVEGMLSGIGGVVVFLPQIMILFGFITVLEDSGYMMRVSFLMDRLMRRMGMSGKSTMPLVSGMACAVPAIMGTRNIESQRDRLITILVTPLMSCSARLPVYTLLISFAVPDTRLWGLIHLQGLVLLGMYLLGWVMAFAAGFVLQFFIKFRELSYYVSELPIYRWPRWKNVLVTMVEKGKVFVIDAGKVIVAISVVLWFLASYGPRPAMQQVDERFQQISQSGLTEQEQQEWLRSHKLEASYAGHIGKLMEPLITPLGFDWKIGIALLTSFAAREVFVGTMATIYSTGAGDDGGLDALRERMRNERHPETGEPVYSVATAFSLMIFFALAMQCMSTLAVVRRETHSWKWPLVQLGYLTGLAYLFSLVTFQLLS